MRTNVAQGPGAADWPTSEQEEGVYIPSPHTPSSRAYSGAEMPGSSPHSITPQRVRPASAHARTQQYMQRTIDLSGAQGRRGMPDWAREQAGAGEDVLPCVRQTAQARKLTCVLALSVLIRAVVVVDPLGRRHGPPGRRARNKSSDTSRAGPLARESPTRGRCSCPRERKREKERDRFNFNFLLLNRESISFLNVTA